jgi:co-chaperonin GroES (HSP10)
MDSPKKELIVVGDRVLIELEKPEERTQVGLYLPQTVIEKERVAGGRIVYVGPGIPVPDPSSAEEEEYWKPSGEKQRYIPLQAQPGDFALFLKKSSVEIKYEGKEYLIVPQSAILVLIRDKQPPGVEEVFKEL